MERPEAGLDGYRAEGAGAERLGVSTFEGVDRRSGERVLIYRFSAQPLAVPGDLDSRFVPRVLWSGRTGSGAGTAGNALVASLPAGARRWREAEGPLSPARLLALARGLRDAAAAGLFHGDIDSGRFLLAGEGALLEGWGVPWLDAPEAAAHPRSEAAAKLQAQDVHDFARAVLATGFRSDDPTVTDVLEQCLAEDPAARPSAEELFLALEALLGDELERAVPPATGGGRDAATVASAATGSGEPQPAVAAVPASARAAASRSATTPPPAPARPAGSAPARETAYWEAELDEPDDPEARSWGMRSVLVGALLVSIIVLALLALFLPARNLQTGPAASATVYSVEVLVSPADLPPVDLLLISTPPGSTLEHRESLGTAPRYLSLDKEGTWVFQGSLQDRRSEPVAIEVPEQRSFTLTIPPAGP